MPRSIKKGPYADAKLLEKVERLNSANRREVIKTIPAPKSIVKMVMNLRSVSTWLTSQTT